MVVRSESNNNDYVLIAKFAGALLFCYLLSELPALFNAFVDVISIISGSVWDAREWFFRFTLDRYIVIFGMISAFATIRIQENFGESVGTYTTAGLVLSAIGLLYFFWFELTCKDKVESV
jgi:hypothetical protein